MDNYFIFFGDVRLMEDIIKWDIHGYSPYQLVSRISSMNSMS